MSSVCYLGFSYVRLIGSRLLIDFIYARKVPFADVLDIDLSGHLSDLLPLLHFVHEWDISVLFIVVENRLIGAISLGTYKECKFPAVVSCSRSF